MPKVGTEQMDNAEVRADLERLHRESYGWALNCCNRDPLQAEEVLQTVYLKILEGKARFGGMATFKTWLFSVIRKTAADERRRTLLRRLRLFKYEERELETSTELDQTDEGVLAGEAIFPSDLQTFFRHALGALSRRQREMLQLVFYNDLTLAEAAEVLRISLGSARTHYERGKKRLRQWMEESHVFNKSRLAGREAQGIIPRTETKR